LVRFDPPRLYIGLSILVLILRSSSYHLAVGEEQSYPLHANL
jgi:hypothetical protein